MPTVLAVASAQVRRQRRRVRLQQAGRLARTSQVARELTVARVREQAVRECHEAAHAEAALEASAAQSNGLLAIAEALNRPSEQNQMLHGQTQSLMSRLIAPATETTASVFPDTEDVWGPESDWQTPGRVSVSPGRRAAPGPY